MDQEWLLTLIRNEITKYRAQDVWGTWATIVDYNEANHTAMVRLEPDGEDVGPVPVGTWNTGAADTILPGTLCWVAMTRKRAELVVCVVHNDNSPVPEAALTLGNDVHIQGNLRLWGGSLQVGSISSLPTPTSDLRGQFALVSTEIDGESGTADQLYICLQAADGSLSWKPIVTG